MKSIRILLFIIVLVQVACHKYDRSDSCAPPHGSNFGLEIKDKDGVLLISVHNDLKEDVYVSQPPEYSDILGTEKTRKDSIICLGEDPGSVPFVSMPPGGSLYFRIQKKDAIAEIEKIKSSRNFRFVYGGLAAYSGVCKMDADSKIECQPPDRNDKSISE